MKKYLAIFAMAFAAFTFTACSSDNDPLRDVNPPSENNPSDNNSNGTNPIVSGIAPMSGKVNLWYTPKIPMQ